MIKTAEEVYNDFHFNYKGNGNIVLEAMKEFVKLHIKACKEEIKKEAKVKLYFMGIADSYSYSEKEFGSYKLKQAFNAEVDEESIDNTYPETNIR